MRMFVIGMCCWVVYFAFILGLASSRAGDDPLTPQEEMSIKVIDCARNDSFRFNSVIVSSICNAPISDAAKLNAIEAYFDFAADLGNSRATVPVSTLIALPAITKKAMILSAQNVLAYRKAAREIAVQEASDALATVSDDDMLTTPTL